MKKNELNIKEAAAYLNVSRQMIEKRIKKNQLPGAHKCTTCRNERSTIIPLSDLNKFKSH